MVSILLHALYEERTAPANIEMDEDGELCHLTSGNPLNDTYLKDQLDSVHSVTDLHLVGDDGHIPVHRYVLMGSSEFLMNLLIDQHPSELAVIHLSGFKLQHMTQIVSLVYTGKAVISTCDQVPLFSLMKSLGISVVNIQFRPASSTDHNTLSQLRYYAKQDEMEGVYVDTSVVAAAGVTVDESNSNGVGDTKRSIPEDDGGESVSNSNLPDSNKVPQFLQLSEKFQCRRCLRCCRSEKSLLLHLSLECASDLELDQLESPKQCLICNETNVANDVWGLIDHVTMCRLTKQGSVSKAASEYDNGDKSNLSSPNSSGKLDEDEVEENNIPLAESDPNKVKKKRRRRRPAAYGTPKRRRTRKKADEPEPDTPRSSSPSIDAQDNNELVNNDDDDRKISGVENGVNGLSSDSSRINSPETEKSVDPDLIRQKLGIASVDDISGLSSTNLKTLFRICPVCSSDFLRIKDVSKCLRYHGYRYCWVCFKILPYKGLAFDTHAEIEHCGRNESGEISDKVRCPLCPRDFEYKLALPTHLGNFHCQRLIDEPVSDDDDGDDNEYSEVSVKVEAVYAEQYECDSQQSCDLSVSDLPIAQASNSILHRENIENDSKLRQILSGPTSSKVTEIQAQFMNHFIQTTQSTPEENRSPSPPCSESSTIPDDTIVQTRKRSSNRKSKISIAPASAWSETEPKPSNSSSNQNSVAPLKVEEETNVSGPSNQSPETPNLSKEPQTVKPSNKSDTEVPKTPELRKFLRKAVVHGVLYNFYCNINDPKKIIAIRQ